MNLTFQGAGIKCFLQIIAGSISGNNRHIPGNSKERIGLDCILFLIRDIQGRTRAYVLDVLGQWSCEVNDTVKSGYLNFLHYMDIYIGCNIYT